MHSTEGRCYAPAEMRDLLPQVGFKDVGCRETLADRSVVVATKGMTTLVARPRAACSASRSLLAVITYLDRICISAAAPFIMDELHI